MSQEIGDKLRETRQELEISLEQAAEETRIRMHYLQALEEGNFSRLPSKAHERGFLRSYAEYLGLDPDSLLVNIASQEEPALEPQDASAAQVEPRTPKDSQVVFETLGDQLRAQRELLGFSLQEVERNIHIRQQYLEALEAGKIEDLPSPVQGRGMLQNYASFLSLDVDAILLKYADGLQSQLTEKRAAKAVESDTKPNQRRTRFSFAGIFPGDWILRTVLIIAVLAFVVWGVIQINSIQAAINPVETIPPIADALQSTPGTEFAESPQPTETPLQEETVPAAVPGEGSEVVLPPVGENEAETPVPTESDAPVQVYVSVLRRAWMRVSVDGEVEFEGRVIPGSAYSFSGEFQIEVLTGNGAALQVFFNGEDQGVMGVYGEVVYEVYTPEGILLPTPTNTPLPTNTPVATSTPTETPEP